MKDKKKPFYLGYSHLYKKYPYKASSKIEHPHKISYSQFCDISYKYFFTAIELMLESGKEFILPYNMGRFFLVRYHLDFTKTSLTRNAAMTKATQNYYRKYSACDGWWPKLIWKFPAPYPAIFKHREVYKMRHPGMPKDKVKSLKGFILNYVRENPSAIYKMREIGFKGKKRIMLYEDE